MESTQSKKAMWTTSMGVPTDAEGSWDLKRKENEERAQKQAGRKKAMWKTSMRVPTGAEGSAIIMGP